MDFSKLNFLLPDQFAANSFAEKIESGVTKLANLLTNMDASLENFNDETDTYPTQQEFVDSVLNNQSTGESIDGDSCIALDKGFTNAETLANQMYPHLLSYWQDEEPSFADKEITLYDAAGNERTETIGEAIEYLKTSIITSSCQATALRSMTYSSVSDKLNYFNQKVSNFIDTNNSDYSSTISYFKDQLLQYSTVRDMTNNIVLASGANSMANSEPVTIQDTDISSFTGGSPLSAFAVTTAKNVAVGVGVAVGAAFVAVGKAIAGVASWLFKKVSKGFNEIFINPYDVTDSGDANEKYCFTGFQFQADHVTDSIRISSDQLKALYPTTESCASLNEFVANTMEDRWYKTETYAGEVCYKIHSAIFEYDNIITTWLMLRINYTWVFKPYSVNPESVLNQTTSESIDDVVDYLSTFTGDLYLDAKADEIDLARAFYTGIYQTKNICDSIFASIVSQYASDWIASTDLAAINAYTRIPNGTTITNKDFLNLASGAYVVNDVVQNFKSPLNNIASDTGTRWYNTSFSLVTLPAAIILMRIFQKLNPLQVDANTLDNLYVPYTVDVDSISNGRFSIKTDSQNQNIANAIVNVLIVVAVVVIGFCAVKIIARKIAKRRFWKYTEFVGRCDNAMWNGQTLSARDKRRYIRYQKKLGMSNVLTSGLVSGAKQTANDVSSFMQSPLVSTILGDNVDPTEVNLEKVTNLIKPQNM